jgi:hypothetical protein
VQPQTLTQTYIEEEQILPEVFCEEIQKTEIKARDKIAETEKNRQKKSTSQCYRNQRQTKSCRERIDHLDPDIEFLELIEINSKN